MTQVINKISKDLAKWKKIEFMPKHFMQYGIYFLQWFTTLQGNLMTLLERWSKRTDWCMGWHDSLSFCVGIWCVCLCWVVGVGIFVPKWMQRPYVLWNRIQIPISECCTSHQYSPLNNYQRIWLHLQNSHHLWLCYHYIIKMWMGSCMPLYNFLSKFWNIQIRAVGASYEIIIIINYIYIISQKLPY